MGHLRPLDFRANPSLCPSECPSQGSFLLREEQLSQESAGGHPLTSAPTASGPQNAGGSSIPTKAFTLRTTEIASLRRTRFGTTTPRRLVEVAFGRALTTPRPVAAERSA